MASVLVRGCRYSELENILIQLELLAGILPSAAARYPELYRDRDSCCEDKDRLKLFQNMDKKQVNSAAATGGTGEAKQTKSCWASGTGYGHSKEKSSEVWDSRASIAAQKHRCETSWSETRTA